MCAPGVVCHRDRDHQAWPRRPAHHGRRRRCVWLGRPEGLAVELGLRGDGLTTRFFWSIVNRIAGMATVSPDGRSACMSRPRALLGATAHPAHPAHTAHTAHTATTAHPTHTARTACAGRGGPRRETRETRQSPTSGIKSRTKAKVKNHLFWGQRFEYLGLGLELGEAHPGGLVGVAVDWEVDPNALTPLTCGREGG